MDSKYQEALDFLLTYPRIIETDGGVSVEALANARESLQELIDQYAELEKALELACVYLEVKSSDALMTLIHKEEVCGTLRLSNRTSEEWKGYLLQGWKDELIAKAKEQNK